MPKICVVHALHMRESMLWRVMYVRFKDIKYHKQVQAKIGSNEAITVAKAG